ncbi:MAG: [LysW]-lysine hydrolase [Halobacteriota archaeon]
MSVSDAITDGWAHQLVIDLVSAYSPSGAEDAVAEHLVSVFEEHGRSAWCDEVGNVRAPADDVVLLTSHMDTVTGELPVVVTEEDQGDEVVQVLHGRGSVDAKGSLAAMAAVALATGVSFAGVVREESDSAGARHLIEDRAPPARVINGEPSGWEGITLGYRGMQRGTYHHTTSRRHHSEPEPNAIEHAVSWWNRVAAAVDDEGGPFERVSATPHAIDGGVSADGLAHEVLVEFELRAPPGESFEALRQAVASATEVGSCAWEPPIPPHRDDPRTPLASALRAAIRAEGGQPQHLLKGGTADANLFADAWGCPVVTYGPGDASLDHTPEEHLSLVEFDRSIAVLERAIAQLRGEPHA